MEKIHCRQGYLVSAWALSWVQRGCKRTAEKLLSLLFVSVSCLPVCLPPSHLLVKDSVSHSLVLLLSLLH